jgi:uncharacterized protein (DUF433 family)
MALSRLKIWEVILDQLAADELIADYPQLTREDIHAAIAYGAEAARERIIPVPTERVA